MLSCRYFWPHWSKMDSEGNLVVKVTGYEDEAHWTGADVIKPSDEDFGFWNWLIQGGHCQEVIDEAALFQLQNEYRELPETAEVYSKMS